MTEETREEYLAYHLGMAKLRASHILRLRHMLKEGEIEAQSAIDAIGNEALAIFDTNIDGDV